jgi:hypothetical protein
MRLDLKNVARAFWGRCFSESFSLDRENAIIIKGWGAVQKK